MSITLQYIIVSAVIVAALVYMAVSLRRKRGARGDSCSGCALSDNCGKLKNKKRNIP